MRACAHVQATTHHNSPAPPQGSPPPAGEVAGPHQAGSRQQVQKLAACVHGLITRMHARCYHGCGAGCSPDHPLHPPWFRSTPVNTSLLVPPCCQGNHPVMCPSSLSTSPMAKPTMSLMGPMVVEK